MRTFALDLLPGDVRDPSVDVREVVSHPQLDFLLVVRSPNVKVFHRFGQLVDATDDLFLVGALPSKAAFVLVGQQRQHEHGNANHDQRTKGEQRANDDGDRCR